MKKQGRIVRWDAARGFGFIRSPATAADIFFHLRDFDGAGAPREGMAVRFEEIRVGGKGPRAMAVQAAAGDAAPGRPRAAEAPHRPAATAVQQARPRRPASSAPAAAPTGPVLLLMLAWAVLVVWGVWAGRLPRLALAAAPLLNLATFYVYWTDKHAARNGRWRTRESTLHLLGLLGGWPGAWWAHQILRHKSRKVAFRQAYWATVLLHGAALVGWLFWLQPSWPSLS